MIKDISVFAYFRRIYTYVFEQHTKRTMKIHVKNLLSIRVGSNLIFCLKIFYTTVNKHRIGPSDGFTKTSSVGFELEMNESKFRREKISRTILSYIYFEPYSIDHSFVFHDKFRSGFYQPSFGCN
jgi:hypothetical protein